MESNSESDFIILTCKNPNTIQPNENQTEAQISTTDIQTWNISTLLRFQTLHIQTPRRTLSRKSSYFHGLLTGNFSESELNRVLIEWDTETFVNILKFVNGCSVDITSSNFLNLYEGALYYGVERLLEKCRDWFREVSSECNDCGTVGIKLDDLIRIWSFGVDHAYDVFQDLCASCIAKNFMWAVASKFFVEIPYKLLLCCVKHPHLTVYSEMDLTEALIVWLDANWEQLESSREVEDDYFDSLKEIRTSLLPLWFASGRGRFPNFAKIADDSVKAIFRLTKTQAVEFIDSLGDGCFDHLRIRLSEYSKMLDLSGCPQFTSIILVLSLLPNSLNMYHMWRQSIKQCLINPEDVFSWGLLPVLSFEAVEELDISKCTGLHVETAIICFSKAFPSLRKLKAAYLWNFKIEIFYNLIEICPYIGEVDLTVDVTPISHAQESFVSDHSMNSNSIFLVPSTRLTRLTLEGRSEIYVPSTRLTRLTLEGRSEIYDSDLQCVGHFCPSLQYINLKGCGSITDLGISCFIQNCHMLDSLLVCDTSFGTKSVQALCVTIKSSISHGDMSSPLVCNLKTLHIGGCKGVDEGSLLKLISRCQTFESLCLRNTSLVDTVLFSFSGSSLETLDVSDTKISGVSLAYIISENPSLKRLKARGCKNLIQPRSTTNGVENSSLQTCKNLYDELAKKCTLEEIAFGWSFSWISLEALKPAIMSLRAVTIGLGGSLDENALSLLSTACPMLERIILYFQLISDVVMKQMMTSLRCLQELSLCFCIGDISISSFKCYQSKLTKLKLQRVTSWMTNDDLSIFTEYFPYLRELSLLGCRLLNSDSLHIISHGWPGLISFHLEDCGGVTAEGVSSLFNLRALEDLLLRHNGKGIPKSFIFYAVSEMPMLRLLSLDLCDVRDGEFDLPGIARCKLQRSSSTTKFIAHRRMVHEDTLVQVRNSLVLIETVVKERI